MKSTAEMIFTGDELLRGDIVNTNQSYLGEQLLRLGVFATRALSIADDLAAITQAIQDSLARRPLVLVLSGGLGPTDDDLTREATAAALGRPLVHHEELLEDIQRRFAQRGMKMVGSNRKQAALPEGATAIPASGTAPGFYLDAGLAEARGGRETGRGSEAGSTLVVALPGVPRELREMWVQVVDPLLRERVASDSGYVVRRLKTFGWPESLLAEKLKDLEWRGAAVDIGTRASIEGLMIILKALDAPEGRQALAATEARIREVMGDAVYGVEDDDLAAVTGSLLRKRGLTAACAESCTGGLLGKRLTDTPGSSDYFLGGVIAYSNKVKVAELGVDPGVLEARGAVSEEVAAAMAQGAAGRLGADCVLSTTGIAGPDGGTPEKPVGLVYVGCTINGHTTVERLMLWGRRAEVRERAAQAALSLLRRRLLASP
jgi:nicotinamide-nucleotide amidase